MFKEIDASLFEFDSMFYDQEFQIILCKITHCYQFMINDDIKVPNDENRIRNRLVKGYLNNHTTREKLNINYRFICESSEINSSNYRESGFTDIMIITLNDFQNPDAYYIIECKRLNNQNLNGTSGLNAEYIKEGIIRFVNGKYSTYYRVNGMIGFVVENMNIEQNIENINTLLINRFPKANTKAIINKTSFIENFEYQYFSIHQDKNDSLFKLYHLIFDFSDQINNSI